MYNNVLVIDDSDIDRSLTRMVIKKKCFAEHIICFNSVESGLSYLQLLFPDEFPVAIFLDINMPDMDGFDFLDNFLKYPDDIRDRCSVFIVSGTDSGEDIERIKHYPIVQKFFPKPLTPVILDDINECVEIGSNLCRNQVSGRILRKVFPANYSQSIA